MLLLATPCMGRLDHLRDTLPVNAQAASMFPGVELLLLDYSCPQDCGAWAAGIAPSLPARLHVFRTRSPQRYNHAHAKNACARLAIEVGATLICNVDADNYVTVDYLEQILAVFAEQPSAIIRSPTTAAGRIACSASVFISVNGYDERMRGWGVEDCDFMARAWVVPGVVYHPVESRISPIAHSSEVRMANMPGESLTDSHRRNSELYRENRKTPMAQQVFGIINDLERLA